MKTGNIKIDGRLLDFAQFGEIKVSALEGNRRLDSETVGPLGEFNLQFNSSTGKIDLEFESDSLTAKRQMSVTDNSEIILDVSINIQISAIIFEKWQVFQDPIFLTGERIVSFSESEAELFMDGDGGDCLKGIDDIIIEFIVKKIDLSDCREGIRVQGSASVILEADESISLISNRDAIFALDDSFVRVGKTLNPVNNSIVIQSINQNGINASGNAVIEIDPQNSNCSIRGGRNAVNSAGNSSVDTDGCTLIDG